MSLPPTPFAGVLLDLDDAAFLGAALRQLIASLDRQRQRPVPREFELEQQLSCSAVASGRTRAESADDPEMELSTTNLLDSETAARLLHCSPENVRGLCRRGSLPGQRVAGRWLIPAEAVHDRAEKRRETT